MSKLVAAPTDNHQTAAVEVEKTNPNPKQNSLTHVATTVAQAVGIFFGGQIIGPVLIVLIGTLLGVDQERLVSSIDANTFMRFVTILVIEIFTVGLLLKVLKYRRKKLLDIGVGKKPQGQDVVKGVLVYMAYILIYLGVLRAVNALQLINTEQPQQLGFTNIQGIELIFVFVSLVILPPIVEEILFRGFLYKGLRDVISPLKAGLITSILFGMAHLEFGSGAPLNWAAAIDTFTLSCVLVYAVERYRSLWPSIVVHGLKNGLAFLVLFVIK